MYKTGLLAAVGIIVTQCACGATIVEDFSSNPRQHGWQVFGDSTLFRWDVTNQNLAVTWDSTRSNSYFYHALGTVLTRSDDFSVSFDLTLLNAGPASTNKPSSFPIALGFLNLDQSTKTNFIRGTGADSPDLAEFSYFWDSGFGATTWPVLVGTNSTFNFNSASDYAIFALAPGDGYHVLMRYTASNETLVATVTNFENTSGIRVTQPVNSSFGDYRVGSFSVSSYSDAGQDPQFAGSVIAHGIVDNLIVTVPEPPLANVSGSFTNSTWVARFAGQTNWMYTLQQTVDLRSWADVSAPAAGTGTEMALSDTNRLSGAAFYRVRATRP